MTRTRNDARRPPPTLRLRAPAVVLFLSFVDVFALLPTVAPHVESLGAGPLGIGVAVAAYSAANLPANVVGGILVDRFGRRPILVIGLLLAAAAVAAYPLAASVPMFVLVRLAHGAAGGVLVPAVFAAAGDRVRHGHAGRAFGRLGAVIGLAAVVAPASAGALRQAAGTDAVFLGVAAVLLVAAMVAIVAIRDAATAPAAAGSRADSATDTTTDTTTDTSTDTAARTAEDALATATSTSLPSWRPLLRSPALRRGLLATVALTAAVGVLAAFLPGAAEDAGAPASAVGGLFTTYALVAGAVMLSPLAGRIDRTAESRTAAAGLALLAVALLWLATASQLWSLALGSALFGAGYGLVFPAVAGATSAVAVHGTRGRAFGLFNAAFSLGIAAGPPLVGLAVQRSPQADPFVLAGAVTAVLAICVAWRRTPGHRQHPG